MVDLGDRRAEPLLQLRLCRLDVLTLALQRARLRKMELDRENPDIAGAHGGIEPAATNHRLWTSKQACGPCSARSPRLSSRLRRPGRIRFARSATPTRAGATRATSSSTRASPTSRAGTAATALRKAFGSTT